MVDNIQMNKTTLQINLHKLLDEVNWTPTELARRSGVAQPTVKRILDGESKEPKRHNIEKIAKAFFVSVESLFIPEYKFWPYSTRKTNLNYSLYHGKIIRRGLLAAELDSEKQSQVSENLAQYENSATKSPQSSTEHIQGKRLQQKTNKPTMSVPLINEVQAGRFSETIDIYEPGYAQDWVSTESRCSKLAFALIVKGDSMEPEFKNGVTIIIDPEAEVNPGDYVIVRNNGDNEAVFKRLVKDGTGLSLMPTNPRYDKIPLTEDSEVIGKVIEQVLRVQY